MSWVFGTVDGSDTASLLDRIAARSGLEVRHRLTVGRTSLIAGGPPETCRLITIQASTDAPESVTYLVLGLGVRVGSDPRGAATEMSDTDWVRVLTGGELPLPIAGHHVVIRLDSSSFSCFNDSLGLRTLYLRRWKGRLLFSTRLDLLAASTGEAAIRLDVLGAQWLTFNRWTSAPLLANTGALGQGGRARYTGGRLSIHETPWTAIPATSNVGDLERRLLRYATMPGVSLGLSGGLDSRLLLALSLGAGMPPQTHVFGDDSDPDVQISKRIAGKLGLDQRHLSPSLPTADACIHELRAHAAEVAGIVPASQSIKLLPYAHLHEAGCLVQDGGFGEIARRQFMNRVVRRAPKSLLSRDAQTVLPLVSAPKLSIFSNDALKIMRDGALSQLAEALAGMPEIGGVDAAEYADHLAVRTRLPWYFGIEQARMDGKVRNLMPYAQPDVLSAVVNLPLKARRRGRAVKRILRRNAPALARIPLVKGPLTLPFHTPAEAAWVAQAVRARLGKPSPDRLRHAFLLRLQTYVQDLVESQPVRSASIYDHRRLTELTEDYYTGNLARGAELDWWLALEAWRQPL